MRHTFRALVLFLVIGMAALPAALLAQHGSGQVAGTVTAIGDGRIEVKTHEKTVSVPVNEKTKYVKGEAEAKAADVKVGGQVSITLAGDGPAAEIRLPAGGQSGPGAQVMGTVTAIGNGRIEVKTHEKTVSIPVNEKTKYVKGEAQAKASDVKVGAQVTVHLAEDGSVAAISLPAASGSTHR